MSKYDIGDKVVIRKDLETDPSEEIKNEIINAALDKLNNAYLNESTVTIATRDILVIQSLINESNVDYKFNLK